MQKSLSPQRLADLSDIPTNSVGALDGEPGQVLVVNANRDGLEFAPAGTGGTPGPAGPGNVLTIGTVAKGDEAAASIVGISPTQVLNLVLPVGDRGVPGVQGIPGPAGEQGAGLLPDGYGNLTEALVASTEAAAVNFVYVVNPSGDLRANKLIPAGISGDQSLKIIGYTVDNGWRSYGQFTGVQGQPGPVNSLSIGTVQAGPVAAATISGSSPVQVLNLTLPKGDKGDPGLKGDPGNDGITQDITGKLNRTGDKTSGVIVFGAGTRETSVLIEAANIDVSLGSVYTKTITAATTFTVSGTSAVAGEVDLLILEITNGGASLVTWWADIRWEDGAAPSLTAAGTDVVGFYKIAGTPNWAGLVLSKNLKSA